MKKETQQKMFETVHCNICGKNDYTVIYEAQPEKEKDKDLKEKFRASGDESLVDQVVKCNNCGLVYINPRLKEELIVEGYSEGSDENFVSQADAREATFTSSLKEIEKQRPQKGKILDIGTAGGSFLAAAKKRGWEVSGCEPNKWMAAWGKKNYGIDIKPGTLFDQKFKTETFDVVTLWDVIEHTGDPSKVLKECNRILKKDGLLVINYPDFGSWIAKGTKRKWAFLLSVHLYYFTPETIKKILEKCGYEMIKLKPHFQKLELGYLLFRMQAYNSFISKIGGKIAKGLHMDKLRIPYWLGQTFVVAKKK